MLKVGKGYCFERKKWNQQKVKEEIYYITQYTAGKVCEWSIVTSITYPSILYIKKKVMDHILHTQSPCTVTEW